MFFWRRKSTPIDPVSPPSDFIGLKNQGKTCHLNTVLQALFMTNEFRVALQECAAADKLEPLPDALCSLFEKLETSNRSVSTKPISATLKRLGFQELNEQQDAHDIWLRLNDRLEHELRTSKRPRLVNELFEGKQKQYVTCGTCGGTSETVETFSCLELNVPAGDEVGDEPPDVVSALRERQREEELSGDAQYFCERCDCKRDAVRGVRLSHLPPILSFHLARFRYRRVEKQPGHMGCLPLCGERDGDHRLVKLTTPLRFSQTLHMAEFTGAEPTAGGGASAAAASANDASAAAASADVSADAAAAAAADANASSVASPDVSRRLDLELTDADEDDPPAAAAISGASSGARGSAERPEAMATGEPQPQPQPPQQATSQQQQAGLDYELYAVVMHVGSPSNGHYYALIQDASARRWFQFNDERVLPMLESELQNAAGTNDVDDERRACAYMLLYRRKGPPSSRVLQEELEQAQTR